MENNKRFVFVGTWGKRFGYRGRGIYTLAMDTETGALEMLHTLDVREPGVLAVSPDGKYLFSINELSKGLDDCSVGGGVTAMKIGEDGILSIINQTSSLGSVPCYLDTDPTGRYVVTAIHASDETTSRLVRTENGFARHKTYDEAGIALFKVGENGALTPKDFLPIHFPGSANYYLKKPELAERGYPWDLPFSKASIQMHAYVHCAAFIDESLFFVTDHGTDMIYLCELDRELEIVRLVHIEQTDLGMAPRHMVLHPSKPYLYLTHEIEPTIGVFQYDKEKRTFWRIQVADTYDRETAAPGVNAGACDIHIRPDGKFLYVSDRNTSELAAYKIDDETGKVTRIQMYVLGKAKPRSIRVTPDGRFLVVGHQDADEIETLAIGQDGKLSPTGHIVKADTPCCIRFSG